ncbi:MAG: helix-turn-helix domain-containing protein [Actinomycetota bacterium]
MPVIGADVPAGIAPLMDRIEHGLDDLVRHIVEAYYSAPAAVQLPNDETMRARLEMIARRRAMVVIRALRDWRPLDAIDVAILCEYTLRDLVAQPPSATERARFCQVAPNVVVQSLKRELRESDLPATERLQLVMAVSNAGLSLSAQISAAVYGECFTTGEQGPVPDEGSVIGDLLAGRIDSEQNAQRRAAASRITLGAAHAVAVIELVSGEGEDVARHVKALSAISADLMADALGPQTVLAMSKELAVIVRLPLGVRDQDIIGLVASAVKKAKLPGGVRALAGIGGRMADALGIGVSWTQALAALSIARTLRDIQPFITYESAIPYLIVREQPALAQTLYRATIEPLVRSDRTRATQLVRTLDAYISSGGNVVETAKLVFAHRQTLYARLKRIEELTHRRLANADDLLLFAIGRCFSRMFPEDG